MNAVNTREVCLLSDSYGLINEYGENIRIPPFINADVMRFFGDVYDFVVESYEGMVSVTQPCNFMFELDSNIKAAIREDSLRIFLDEVNLCSVYEAIVRVVKYVLGVIKMSDDCSIMIDSDIKNFEVCILEYIIQRSE